MTEHPITLNRFILSEHRESPGASGEFSALLQDIVTALKAIAHEVSNGPALRASREPPLAGGGGESPRSPEALANDILLRGCEWGGHLSAMASEEMQEICPIPAVYPHGKYLLVFDPLDGASNIDVNISVGTIFSVLRRPDGAGTATLSDFLQPGTHQLCAGYAIYGPSTMVVMTVGRGVHGFTLDRQVGEFVLTHRNMRMKECVREFAVNASNERFWEPPVRRYVSECLAGRAGPREADYNMRWVASLVAEVHRILVRGGLLLCPRDSTEPRRPGPLSLLFESNPMALIIEQAGGAASTGRGRLLEVQPTALHERVPLVLGSRDEVERIERYHEEHERGLDQPYRSPLFAHRSLFTSS